MNKWRQDEGVRGKWTVVCLDNAIKVPCRQVEKVRVKLKNENLIIHT